MTDALYLTDLTGVTVGGVVQVGGDEGRHAAVVKRTRVGESVLVSDGAGHAACGEVIEVTKQSIAVQVGELLDEPAGRHRWTVVQGLAKGDRSEIAVEAMTELGADRIIAWQASRSVSRWDGKVDKGIAKWQSTAREATKQSRRFRVPEVGYLTTRGLTDLIAGAALAVICHEEATEPLVRVPLPVDGEVVVVVGPEGGISPDELDAFRAAGGRLVSLGGGVLRTSTAGLVALAQLAGLATLQS